MTTSLTRLRHRVHGQEGFTLIELLVVILIIGILAAIAIPSFLNQKAKGDDASVKSNLRNAATAMETYATDNGSSYANATQTSLTSIEPTIPISGIEAITLNPAPTTMNYSLTANDTQGRSFTYSRQSDGSIVRSCSQGSASNPGGCVNNSW